MAATSNDLSSTPAPHHLNASFSQFTSAAELIPADPLSTHTAPAGRDSADVTREKHANLEQMQSLGADLTPAERALVAESAGLAMELHFNQFRSGKGSPHYSAHLLEVARRVDANFESLKTDFPEIRSASGEPLNPRALCVSLAILHDTLEDFHVSFRGMQLGLTEEGFAKLAREHVSAVLSRQLDPKSVTLAMRSLDSLTIKNQHEFPTQEYLRAIKSDPFAYHVKLADVDHNLTTFPDFSCAYPSLIIPAQYRDFPAGAYGANYKKELAFNIANLDPDERPAWKRGCNERTVDHLLDLVEQYEGFGKLKELEAFYRSEEARGLADLLDAELREKFAANLAVLHDAVASRTGIPESFPSQRTDVQGIGVQILGPVPVWGADIAISDSTVDQVKEAVRSASLISGLRISGYIREENGEVIYHTSRVPRRLGVEMTSLIENERVLEALETELTRIGPVRIAHDSGAERSVQRAILGLDEGYYEQRRIDLLKRIPGELSDLNGILSAFSQTIGDPSSFGFSETDVSGLDRFVDRLRTAQFSTRHTLDEVRAALPDSWKVTGGQIFAVTPKPGSQASVYEEPVAMIEAPSGTIPPELIKLGSDFGQARFTLECLATGQARNIEILEFSESKSAART